MKRTHRAKEVDAQARALAYLTVGVPTAGLSATVWYSLTYGVTVSDITLLLVMYAVTSLGIEAGFHRLFAHRAFAARSAVSAALGISGSMAAQGPVLFWVSTHRLHHAFADSDGDPHSPRPRGDGRWRRLRGLWHGHVGWLFTIKRRNWSARVPDLLRNDRMMWVNRYYFGWVALGLALPAAAGGLIADSWRGAVGGLLWGGLTRIFVGDHVTWGVNSIGHTLGSRPHTTHDNSRNVGPLAPLSVGGSWHNNHHAQPGLAQTRQSFWQLDLAGSFIRILDRLSLASDVRYANKPMQDQKGKVR